LENRSISNVRAIALMTRRVLATQFHRLMTAGRTAPLLCGCEDEAERRVDDYIVKLRGSVELGDTGMLCELFASYLANHFGILVPEPALVEVSRSFAEIVASREPTIADKIRRSVGLNFGSRQVTGGGTWPVDRPVPDALFRSAVDTFGFDALIQNPDRRFNNPNLLWKGDEIILYDHEMSFSFLVDVLGDSRALFPASYSYMEQHVFFRRLKRRVIDLDEFKGRLAALTDDVLTAIRNQIPEMWRNDNLPRIESHLRRMRDHADEFIELIRRVLA
jgi:hypothetical protein